jgi:hypothetical protein
MTHRFGAFSLVYGYRHIRLMNSAFEFGRIYATNPRSSVFAVNNTCVAVQVNFTLKVDIA